MRALRDALVTDATTNTTTDHIPDPLHIMDMYC
jgi:hypothetical protein